jgi:hypothetical protein
MEYFALHVLAKVRPNNPFGSTSLKHVFQKFSSVSSNVMGFEDLEDLEEEEEALLLYNSSPMMAVYESVMNLGVAVS